MTAYSAEAAKNHRPANIVGGGAEVAQNSGEFSLSAALALNDTVDLCKLPARNVPVDFVLNADDLDGGSGIVLKVGIYDADGDTDDDDALIASTTVGQTGGIARMDAVAGRKLVPVDYDRIIRVTVSTGPTSGASSGVIGGTLLSREAGLDD